MKPLREQQTELTRKQILDMIPDAEDFAPFLTQLYGELDVLEPRLRAQLATRLGQDVLMRRGERRDDRRPIVDSARARCGEPR